MEKEAVSSAQKQALREELKRIQDCFQVATRKWQELLEDFESFQQETRAQGFEEVFGDILKNAEEAQQKIRGLSEQLAHRVEGTPAAPQQKTPGADAPAEKPAPGAGDGAAGGSLASEVFKRLGNS